MEETMSTKEKILDAALTLFAENGYDGTSVEQIANIVGIKAPSLYKHYKGKEDIMPADKVLFYNRIDIGIFICFMDLCLEHNGIGFEKTLYSDSDDGELVLNAKYRLYR